MNGLLGVYLHFPWCRKLCPYCDFAVAIAEEPPHDAYLAAILDELAVRAPEVVGRRLRSIYLGGGTPSWWRPDCVARAIAAIAERFGGRAADLEITIEANPTDCTPDRLAAWRAAGIERVSIGVQSLDPAELAALGRDHRHGDGPAAVAAARTAGVASISCDFILGTPVPGRDPGEVAATLGALADLAPEHLSVYELTIEERTAFGARARAGRLVPLADDTLAALYVAADALLVGRGYEHYEISSYARPGHRAVHNSLYWAGAEYLGLGAGAASYVRDAATGGGRRWTNLRRASDYLAAAPDARRGPIDAESAADIAVDALWLGMRTSDGVRAADLAAVGGAGLVERLILDGLAVRRGEQISPTLRGFLYADTVAARIVGAQGGKGSSKLRS